MLISPDTRTTSAFDFQRDVLEASRERPILVDFWAPWCGPCRVLGPLLEKLETEANGAWKLIKINTDEHPALSQEAGIRGIPAVKLVVDSELTAEFTGALPEPVLRKWLDEHLPSRAKQLLAEAQQLLSEGQREQARATLEALLSDDPGSEDARLLMARLVAFDDAARAREMVRGLEHRPEADAIATLAEFLEKVGGEDELPDSPARTSYQEAAERLRSDDIDGALGKLIEALKRDRYYDDDGPRRLAVALFQLLGEESAITKKHRPEFNRSLY